MELRKFLETYWNMLFRGFWKGGGKDGYKSRFRNSEPKTFKEAEGFPYLLGALLPEVVLVDIDDPEDFQCMVRMIQDKEVCCVIIESPNRGGHILFYNRSQAVKTGTKSQTLLGFYPVDYKSGSKYVRSTGEYKQADTYCCLSREDKSLRKLVYFKFHDDGTLDDIPFYLLSVGRKQTERPFPYNFLNMKDGDSRNDSLYQWMIPLKKASFKYEEYIAAAEIINQYLFADPLDPSEFETATRRDAWESINAAESLYFSENHFLHHVFGDHLIEQNHIIRINGQIHSYSNGVYVPGYEIIERLIVREIPSLSRAKINEVLNYVRITANETSAEDDLMRIAFNNGILNLDTDKLEPFSPEYIVTNRIPWNYNTDTKKNLTDEVLDSFSCGDSEIRFLLEEISGACLFRSALLGGGKGVILVGDRANGKSTFLYMIECMLGQENYSALDIRELGDRFSTILMYGKLANIGDDISSEYILDTSYMKKLITGETVKAENKGEKPIKFVSFATQIFSANDIPRMKDRSQAAARRLLLVPFNAKFTPGSPGYDPFIRRKLNTPECMERFIYLALCGLHDVLANDNFTVPESARSKQEEYEIENSPILAFIEDVGRDSIINEPTDEVYRLYHVFCLQSGFQPQSKISFVKDINRQLGTVSVQKWISGKNVKMFSGC